MNPSNEVKKPKYSPEEILHHTGNNLQLALINLPEIDRIRLAKELFLRVKNFDQITRKEIDDQKKKYCPKCDKIRRISQFAGIKKKTGWCKFCMSDHFRLKRKKKLLNEEETEK